MGAAREKDQADFDLDRFVDMFDQAMVSRDPRVIDALRSLMMMVILTQPEVAANPMADRQRGPLRRMVEDLGHMNRRLERLEGEVRQATHATSSYSYANQWDELDRYPNEKYANAIKVTASQLQKDIDQQVLNNIMNQTLAKSNKKTSI